MTTKSKPSRKNASFNAAVLEVSGLHTTLLLLEPGEGDVPRVRSRTKAIVYDPSAPHAAINSAAIANTLDEFLEEERLQNVPLHLVLGGDYCVTRIATGTRENVERELQDLRRRSALYLSLGHGAKTFAESIASLDAKRAQGLITVANESTIHSILQGVAESGLKLASIEHSLVALCRAVGQTKIDAESPVLVVEPNRRGFDLGISYQGRLLLDYRPGGYGQERDLAEVVLKHVTRLQRHCGRYCQASSSRIRRIVLCGEGQLMEDLRAEFAASGVLEPITVLPEQIEAPWTIADDSLNSSSLLPTLGTLIKTVEKSVHEATPDLMTPVRLAQREPLVPALVRLCWPLAVAASFGLIAYGLGFYQNWSASNLSAELTGLQHSADQAATKRLEIMSAGNRLQQLKTLAAKTTSLHLHELMVDVGSCLPQGVWLESLKVDRDGNVFLSGPSFTETAVYELVEHLKSVPAFTNVGLEGTRAARLQSGPATLFDLKCNYEPTLDHGGDS